MDLEALKTYGIFPGIATFAQQKDVALCLAVFEFATSRASRYFEGVVNCAKLYSSFCRKSSSLKHILPVIRNGCVRESLTSANLMHGYYSV